VSVPDAVPPFRSSSSGAAAELATREAERLGMRFETEFFGPHRYPVEVSRLLQGDAEVAEGYGKGKGPEGIAGGHFEALERYFMSARINRRLAPGSASLRKAADIAREPGLADDLVIQRWAEDFPEGVAACAAYDSAALSLWYPIFLADPNYFLAPLPGDSVGQYQKMLRYASSLGTASGANVQEAQLHGLCELIEHDAFSHALLRWFIARMPQVLFVDIGSLPDQVRLLQEIAAETAGAEVFLLDVTTDIGVPVYLATAGGAEAGAVGAGASPIGEYAAMRALGELIQLNVLTDGGEARAASARLAAWPTLRECVMASPGKLSSRDAQLIPLRGAVADVSTVESSLHSVTGLLRKRGIYSYTCELTPPESLISVVSTIAPGLERFSLVRMGVPVIPTGRGWSLWTSAH
jgi:ribosomal protein S12 methylthiotransferase accessory factor